MWSVQHYKAVLVPNNKLDHFELTPPKKNSSTAVMG